jgi:hypothetical protein
MKKELPKLLSGMIVSHHGRAVKLLYLSDTVCDGEVWRVQPMFADEHVRDELFKHGDKVSRLDVMVAGE